MKTTFKAITVEQGIDKLFSISVKDKSIDDLPNGDLLVKVNYSSLNYKDALSSSGNFGVTKKYPHTPGIDAVGFIEFSKNENFKIGEEVIVSGYDLGMNTPGGFGEYIRVPSSWACPLPKNLTAKESVAIGTAGLTAGLCVRKLKNLNGISGKNAVVTGATGGVGSFAIKLLKLLGARVTAVTTKLNKESYLNMLGADEIISKKDFISSVSKPMGKGIWDIGVDTVGGDILSNLIPSMKYGGIITCCGNVAGPSFNATVYPFILRANHLVGIDSAETPISIKSEIWNKFSSEWYIDGIDNLYKSVSINEIITEIEKILDGEQVGRVILSHR
tara:strand:+ start:745 stop:1737 length:993 start_codon:yes stop_codon:yes gene_type:complete